MKRGRIFIVWFAISVVIAGLLLAIILPEVREERTKSQVSHALAACRILAIRISNGDAARSDEAAHRFIDPLSLKLASDSDEFGYDVFSHEMTKLSREVNFNLPVGTEGYKVVMQNANPLDVVIVRDYAIIRSVGPDGDADLEIGNLTGTRGEVEYLSNSEARYDPTNGLYSGGDILQLLVLKAPSAESGTAPISE